MAKASKKVINPETLRGIDAYEHAAAKPGRWRRRGNPIPARTGCVCAAGLLSEPSCL